MTRTDNALRLETVVRRTAEPLAADLGGGETVLMSLQREMYYGLDEVGSRIWELLAEPVSLAALCERLVAEYEVDRATCERDVAAYLESLRREGLIEVVDEPDP